MALVWAAGEKKRVRGIPPGNYRVRSVRQEREEKGSHWILSATTPHADARRFTAGKTTRLKVGDTLHIAGRAKLKKKRLQLGFSLQNAAGWGASVYRDDKRVAVTYEVLGKGGRVLASGPMNYG